MLKKRMNHWALLLAVMLLVGQLPALAENTSGQGADSGQHNQVLCTCAVPCGDQMNPGCPVCGAAGAVAADCGFSPAKASVTYPITYHLSAKPEAIGFPKDEFPASFSPPAFVGKGNNPDTYTGLEKVTLNPPDATGTLEFYFDGWYTDENYTNRITEIPVGATGPISLYAKPGFGEYYIAYQPLGGVYSATNPSAVLKGTGFSLGSPTRQGFDFVTWSEAVKIVDGERVADVSASGKTHDVGSPFLTSKTFTVLYAAWKPAVGQVEIHYLDPVDSQEIYKDYGVKGNKIAALSLTPTHSGYTFDGKWYKDRALTQPWDFASDTIPVNLPDAFILYAGLRANSSSGSTGGGSSSGNSSGGSSGGGSSSGSSSRQTRLLRPANKNNPSANVNPDGSVNPDAAVRDVIRQLQEDKAARRPLQAEMRVTNAKSVSPETLQAMAEAAEKLGGTARLIADTVVNGQIVARVYLEAAEAATLTGSIQLGVHVDEASTKATRARFEQFFTNELCIISLDQQGPFGMQVHLAVKLDLTGFDLDHLYFYAYDQITNTYVAIEAPQYWIDTAGYLHFDTEQGGDIIVTGAPLGKSAI